MTVAVPKKSTETRRAETWAYRLQTMDGAEFFKTYGSWFLYAIGGLAVALLLLYRLFWSGEGSAQRDYIDAESTFTALVQELAHPELARDKFERLLDHEKTLLMRHPELVTKYSVTLAQNLLARGLVAEALPYAQGVVARSAAAAVADFRDYGENTLTAASGGDALALSAAVTLQQRLGADEPTLAAFNTLRLAVLDPEVRESLLPQLLRNDEIAGLFTDGQVSIKDMMDDDGSARE